MNKVRQNPHLFVKHLEAMLNKFEGLLLKTEGKTSIRTKEGTAAVHEAMEFLSRQ